jgi:hypothetical protein
MAYAVDHDRAIFSFVLWTVPMEQQREPILYFYIHWRCSSGVVDHAVPRYQRFALDADFDRERLDDRHTSRFLYCEASAEIANRCTGKYRFILNTFFCGIKRNSNIKKFAAV